MGNIVKVKTDMCAMEYIADDWVRENYGDEVADNHIVWNFRQRLGDNVDILSISVVYVVSWAKVEGTDIQIPHRIMYLCTYVDND